MTNDYLVLNIDDDADARQLVERLLARNGYDVITAGSGREGLDLAYERKPDLILLDMMMPEMDGYEVCDRLQEKVETANIPVVFLTGSKDDHDKARAFAAGAVGYLVKPVQKEDLLQKVGAHIHTHEQWEQLQTDPPRDWGEESSFDFIEFREYLFDRLSVDVGKRHLLSSILPSKVYSISSDLGIEEKVLAQHIAGFLNLPYTPTLNPEDIQPGVISPSFSKSRQVIPIRDANSGARGFVLGNPFDWELIETLNQLGSKGDAPYFVISEPGNIDALFQYETSAWWKEAVSKKHETEAENMADTELEKYPILFIANSVLQGAVVQRASDIHIEPKTARTVIRFRVDGDLREFSSIKKETGIQLISRLKLLGDLNLAETRRPQDGAFVSTIHNRDFNLRLSTTSTPEGESLVIRLLEPYVRAKDLTELGMTEKQSSKMVALVNRTSGCILLVGPTGSGKTTSIYSLLHAIDHTTRSLMSVEDPVEYRIPFANQQQVNDKAGITFEALLKTAVRQDPDVLFLGEVRDQYSAKTAVDFASTGHLTITSLHASNSTSAIDRLERLGVTRGVMAEAISAIIAQRLLKRLCPHCKDVVPISQEEIDMLSPFTESIPSMVAQPVGCEECNQTGYYGREGIYEVLDFDAKLSRMVRSGDPVSQIRLFTRKRGGYLISAHAVDKARDLVFTVKDVYEHVLVEEQGLMYEDSDEDSSHFMKQAEELLDNHSNQKSVSVPSSEAGGSASVLVVDDDEDTRKLISRILEGQGYTVENASDGLDAMLMLDKRSFDLVLSDINMPHLDGFKLMEVMNQKGIDTPVIFLTARESVRDEETGLLLGATDYLRKPLDREVLQLRVKRVLGRPNKVGG
ncbi:MAG: Flp pilus assembly complex ATPase component TadA [Chloroflexi bacterium]|jgi:type II secretory ATPase GspE/PulE/Tfp pilus assembly ATPase PilB-like protein|nr:Flp pilus assembly complex ATPase component TadA [Chloroflexota bacterium]